jgi:hypothetical protein
MKRWLVALAILIVALAGAWAWGSPYLTLWQMKKAAEARDVDALSAHIDYPALRTSVKQQLRKRMRGQDIGWLGPLVRGGIADTLVDASLTPDGMRVIFAAAPLAGAARPRAIGLNASEMKMRRDAIDRFRLVRTDGRSGELVFRLRGVTWMLSDIRVPEETFAGPRPAA